MAFCPSCGNEVADTANFCASCGNRLKPAEPPPPSPEPEPPAAPETSRKDTSGLPPSWMPPPVSWETRPSGQSYSPPPAPSPTEPADAPATPSGKDLSGLPPTWMPPPVTPTFNRERTGPDPDWKMSDLGPPPAQKNRRLWLWIPVGFMALVLLCCAGIFIWSVTFGEDTVSRWSTEFAVERTEEAVTDD